jgi:broad specificity phosphatase PhoE
MSNTLSDERERSTVTSLTLVSHASTRALRRALFPCDEPLDPSAFKKVSAAGSLGRARHTWTGPERRATQTAEALALNAVPEPALRDCDYGRWRGRSLEELQAEEPDAIRAWLTDPHSAPHGGESICGVVHRVGAWLDTRANVGGHVVAVTHPAIVRAAIIHAIGAAASSFWRIDVAPLTYTSLRVRKGGWTLRSSGSPLTIVR